MNIFAEPAGGGHWISWEIIFGFPLIGICMLLSVAVFLFRILVAKKSTFERVTQDSEGKST